MTLEYLVATWYQPEWVNCLNSWQDNASQPYRVRVLPKMDIVDAYQKGFEESKADVLSMCHDDLMIYEPNWDLRVLKEFEDPQVGLVGFAGAPGFCHPQMYDGPFNPMAMGRVGFRSNMRTAEQHGARFVGEQDVTILDGLSLFVRREALEKAGGWPVGTAVGYFCYDTWICCMTRSLGYKIRLIGVDCDHLGGRSTGFNPALKMDWGEAHRYIFENFRDVLPAMV